MSRSTANCLRVSSEAEGGDHEAPVFSVIWYFYEISYIIIYSPSVQFFPMQLSLCSSASLTSILTQKADFLSLPVDTDNKCCLFLMVMMTDILIPCFQMIQCLFSPLSIFSAFFYKTISVAISIFFTISLLSVQHPCRIGHTTFQ